MILVLIRIVVEYRNLVASPQHNADTEIQRKLQAVFDLYAKDPAKHFAIGGLHVMGHRVDCQFGMNVKRCTHMGRTGGEECESFNSRVVPFSSSLRKMR